MPELPEVEVACRGLGLSVTGKVVTGVAVRVAKMRWPVSKRALGPMIGHAVRKVWRRGKYLLLQFDHGALLVHLGMSGSLRIANRGDPAGIHDHVDVEFGASQVRMRDPRRFGGVRWLNGLAEGHMPLCQLGIEPLGGEFTGEYLFDATRRFRRPIKQLLLDQSVIAGVGNIYASEGLFRARVSPKTPARNLSAARCEAIAKAIKETLTAAIAAGGTTLQDFRAVSGELGEFQLEMNVYDRSGQECKICSRRIVSIRQGRRSTFYCPGCQR